MAKYHISPSTGSTNICRAESRCPFGGEDSHFEGTKEQANQWAEKKNKEDHDEGVPSYTKDQLINDNIVIEQRFADQRERKLVEHVSERMNHSDFQKQKEESLRNVTPEMAKRDPGITYLTGKDVLEHPAYKKLVEDPSLGSHRVSKQDLLTVPAKESELSLVENKNGVSINRYDYWKKDHVRYMEITPITEEEVNEKAEEIAQSYYERDKRGDELNSLQQSDYLFNHKENTFPGTDEEKLEKIRSIVKEHSPKADELMSAYNFEKGVEKEHKESQFIAGASQKEPKPPVGYRHEDPVETSFIHLKRVDALNKMKSEAEAEKERISDQPELLQIKTATIKNYDTAIRYYKKAFDSLNPAGITPDEHKQTLSPRKQRNFERNVKNNNMRFRSDGSRRGPERIESVPSNSLEASNIGAKTLKWIGEGIDSQFNFLRR